MSQKILSCDLHDYLEIACMFQYQVGITLKSGEVITGQAADVKTLPGKKEILLVKAASSSSAPIEIDITSMSHLKVLTPNARFEQVSFE